VLHMVIFRGAEGKPGYHQTDELSAAAAFAERLRNDDGVTDLRLFRMEEVAIEFKPYFRVEVVAGEDTEAESEIAPPDGEATPPGAPLPDLAEVPAEPPPSAASSSARGFALFGRNGS
jgi:hypothetical protein